MFYGTDLPLPTSDRCLAVKQLQVVLLGPRASSLLHRCVYFINRIWEVLFFCTVKRPRELAMLPLWLTCVSVSTDGSFSTIFCCLALISRYRCVSLCCICTVKWCRLLTKAVSLPPSRHTRSPRGPNGHDALAGSPSLKRRNADCKTPTAIQIITGYTIKHERGHLDFKFSADSMKWGYTHALTLL